MTRQSLALAMSSAALRISNEALGNEAISTDGVEREYVFFGKLENMEQLYDASYWEQQEQWRILVPSKDPKREISVRIRKATVCRRVSRDQRAVCEESVYTLTIKSFLKGEAGTTEAEVEMDPTEGEAMLKIFRTEGDGMVKDRYFFPLRPEDLEKLGVKEDDQVPRWEVDVFRTGNGCRCMTGYHEGHNEIVYHPYVKLDLEVQSYDLKIEQDEKDGEAVGFELPFPVELNDVVYSQPHARTERDAARVQEMMDKYMKAKPKASA